MEAFRNPVDPDKFRRTNAPWNTLMLNDPWSVGYVSSLIELTTFAQKEDWERFYYEMGAYRNRQLLNYTEPQRRVLNDPLLKRNRRTYYQSIPESVRRINTQNGRTPDQLRHKGLLLRDFIKKQHPDISVEDCVSAVRFRVIGETWNGIMLRERQTVKTLQSRFPRLQFIKKPGSFDHTYAVDYEVYVDHVLCCGLQIKPRSYQYQTPYLQRARRANQRKNKLYQEEFGRPVLDVLANGRGEIFNVNVLEQITSMIDAVH